MAQITGYETEPLEKISNAHIETLKPIRWRWYLALIVALLLTTLAAVTLSNAGPASLISANWVREPQQLANSSTSATRLGRTTTDYRTDAPTDGLLAVLVQQTDQVGILSDAQHISVSMPEPKLFTMSSTVDIIVDLAQQDDSDQVLYRTTYQIQQYLWQGQSNLLQLHAISEIQVTVNYTASLNGQQYMHGGQCDLKQSTIAHIEWQSTTPAQLWHLCGSWQWPAHTIVGR